MLPGEEEKVVSCTVRRTVSASSSAVFEIAIGEQDDEFVAAVAARQGASALGGLVEQGTELSQHLATREVAVTVVDSLEVVEIEEQDRQVAAFAIALFQ